jgi:ParB family chromosome partitioning protein
LRLRVVLGEAPDVALIAVTHALAVQSFYEGYDVGTASRSRLKVRP